MQISGADVLVWLVVGAVIGWLASQIMTKGGFGIQGDIMIGVAGAVLSGLFFYSIGFLLGGQQLLGHIVNSAFGAVVATFAGRLFKAAQ